MLENLRNVAVLIAGLAIASCLMAWGIIIATDRSAYADKAAAIQKIHSFKVQRAARID